MDNTPIYIKMCEKAKEIQDKRSKHFWLGDYYSDRKKVFLCAMNQLEIDAEIWLPRQDQLQEMVSKKEWTPLFLFMEFMEFLTEGQVKYSSYSHKMNGSMEQLWLAFVMKEKFNKTWNGEEWISL